MPDTRLRLACLTLNSSPDIQKNIATITPMIDEAAKTGAQLICLPENSAIMAFGRQALLGDAYDAKHHPAIPFFADMALKHKIWLHAGSFAVKIRDDRLANRSYIFDPDCHIRAHYDKIHMFDVDLGNGESYHESALFRAGRETVTCQSQWGVMGLSICYDLRFPYLYRQLAQEGAGLIFVPAAFTATTGKAHWHALLRARAIETGAYVIAPAQTGTHHKSRQTFGHSLIIDPWGKIIADGGTETGVMIADLDLTQITEARAKIPSLKHDRDFEHQHYA